jgi:hypothetical protein
MLLQVQLLVGDVLSGVEVGCVEGWRGNNDFMEGKFTELEG